MQLNITTWQGMKHYSPLVHGVKHRTAVNGWSVRRRTHQSSASAGPISQTGKSYKRESASPGVRY